MNQDFQIGYVQSMTGVRPSWDSEDIICDAYPFVFLSWIGAFTAAYDVH